MDEELSPSPAQPSPHALLALLAYVASADGELHERERELLERAFPEVSGDLLAAGGQATDLDLRAIADQFVTADQRWLGLRWSARMAWKDGRLDNAEQEILAKVAAAMQLPAGAVERVLREMRPDRRERFAPDRLVRVLQEVRWDAVQLAKGPLVSPDLAALLPAGSEVVARVGLDKVELLGLCTDGLVGRFQEGAAFLAWADLIGHGREAALGTGVRLTTEDGRSYVLVDTRLAGLCVVLDRLFDDRERTERSPPVFERVRGD